MKQMKNTHYTKKQVDEILNCIKDCIKSEKWTLSLGTHRIENKNFISEYNLRKERQIEILLNLGIIDFCYSVQNRKQNYEHETLYIFAPKIKVYNVNGEEELLDVYIKFNIIEEPFVIVISFHKCNKPIKRLFN